MSQDNPNSPHPQNSSASRPAAPPPRTTRDQVRPYTLAVVVTTQERIDSIFGSVQTRRGTEQLVCDGGNCAEVTMSVYVPDARVSDPDFRRAALLEGLGFAGRT